MTLYYLATPYTKYADGIDAAFEHAARLAGRLLKAGVVVYSPIAHSHPIAQFGRINAVDQVFWLEANRTMMDASDALLVAQMDGWNESVGVAIETAHFLSAGKSVEYIDCKTLERTPLAGPMKRAGGLP